MRKLSRPIQRLVTAVALAAAFVVMASVFVPDRSRAGDEPASAPSNRNDGAAATNGSGSGDDSPYGPSTDPHAGLACIGQLHDTRYTVKIFSADGGPLYTVSSQDGQELAVLLTARQVEQRFPDLTISAIDFSAPTPLSGPGDSRLSGRTGPMMHAGSKDDQNR